MDSEYWDDKQVEKALAGESVEITLPAGEVLRLRRGRTGLVIDKVSPEFYNIRTATVGEEGRPTGRST